MNENKEKNFVSAVVYVRDNENTVLQFLKSLDEVLSEAFLKYEIICVDDNSTDNSVKKIQEFGESVKDSVVSIIHMSYCQGLEASMNAGVELSIGDFVYEFDGVDTNYDFDIVRRVYEHSIEGYDIVSAVPDRAMRFSSKYFYRIFNTHSNIPNKLETESFRILSRRGINRVHAMSKTIPYRKAVYAGCGLKTSSIKYKANNNTCTCNVNDFRWNTAIDALILYTNVGYKISLALTFIMMLATLCSGIYAVYVFFNSVPIAGWTTTMLVISFSFFGLFAVSAIIIKYLTVIISLIFNKQKYVIEGIDKITK